MMMIFLFVFPEVERYTTFPNHHNKQIKELVTIRESFGFVENI